MDHKAHDKVFFVNFGKVLGALFGIFFFCIIAARIIVGDSPRASDSVEGIQARVKPVATVVTDPAALMKVAAKTARAPMTGDEVNAKICNACHGSGVLDAPKTGDKLAWAERKKLAGGLDGLVMSAIKGKAQMPPKGGDPSLSDDEIKAAVEQMLKQTGA